MNRILLFINDNNSYISVLLSLASVVIALLTLIITRRIFSKGLSINEERVRLNLCLELYSAVILPLKKIKEEDRNFYGGIFTKNMDVENNKTVPISTLFVNLSKINVQTSLDYFFSHNGEIWYALSNLKDTDGRSTYMIIDDFVRKAQELKNTFETLMKKRPNEATAGTQSISDFINSNNDLVSNISEEFRNLTISAESLEKCLPEMRRIQNSFHKD